MMAEETQKEVRWSGLRHIHHANVRTYHGIDYYNCGDWIDSCTVLVEHCTGDLSLLRWSEMLEHQSEKKKRLKIFTRS